MIELIAWAIGILAVLLGTTRLIRMHVKGTQSWYIVSMLKFTKPLKIFDAFRNHPRLVNALTDFGLIIGFGAIAVDYMWMQKHPVWQRVLVFAASTGVLGLSTSLVFPTSNPIIPIPEMALQLAFGVFGFAGLILVSLFYSGLDIYTKLTLGKNACAGVAPVIPGVDLPNSPISVPLHAWLSFLIILVVHEASHGFVIRKLGMKLQSYGLLLLGFLPIGAFVEPDERELKQLERKNPRDALRMYAAGPASNFYFFMAGGIILTLLGGLIISPVIMPTLNSINQQSVSGVQIESVEEKIIVCGTEFPAPAYGLLQGGDQILRVNDTHVENIQQYSKTVSGLNEYDLTILRDGKEKQFAFTPNDLGRIGITVKDVPNPDYTPPGWYNPFLMVAGFIASFLGWLLLLNFLVATANFIPVDPFDGGKMAKLLLSPYFGFLRLGEDETKKLIGKIFGAILIVLIIVNAAPLLMVAP